MPKNLEFKYREDTLRAYKLIYYVLWPHGKLQIWPKFSWGLYSSSF